jgi:hypothetical protein
LQLACNQKFCLLYSTVQRERITPCIKISRALLAGWLVAWMLFSSFLSASPVLHEHFHENAAQSTHQCVVTLLEQQQLLTGELQSFVFAAEFSESELSLLVTNHFVPQGDVRLLPSRGPPVLS